MHTSKLETQPIHKEKQTDTNKEQTEGKFEVQVQSTEKEVKSKNEKSELLQSNLTEKKETKTDKKEEEQMNNKENIKN